MVDIPEYLLQRSREAMAKAKGEAIEKLDEEGEVKEEVASVESASEETETAEVPDQAGKEGAAPPVPEPATVPASSTAPIPQLSAPAAPVMPAPVYKYAPASRPVGTKEKFRGAKVPPWLMSVYLLVPALVVSYLVAFVSISNEKAAEHKGPDGAALYANNCASCHGANGKGTGTFPSLENVVKIFPNKDDHLAWVEHIADETDGPYGEGGTGNAGKGSVKGNMPAFGKKFGGVLSDEELKAVVEFERKEFGGETGSESA